MGNVKVFFVVFLLALSVQPVDAFWGAVWNFVSNTASAAAKIVYNGYKTLENVVDDLIGGTAKKYMELRGTLLCNGKPYKGGKIEIKEKDWLWDDTFTGTISIDDGTWRAQVNAQLDALWNENEPYILVRHACNMGAAARGCYNQFEKPVPVKASYKLKADVIPYNMGTMELSILRDHGTNSC